MALLSFVLAQNHFRPKAIEEKALSPFLDRTVFVGGKKTDRKEVKIRTVVCKILEALQEEGLSGRCKVVLGGSYLSHLLVRPRLYHDADCKILLLKEGSEDPVELTLRVESAVKRALLSCLDKSQEEPIGIVDLMYKRMYMKPLLFPSCAMARYSFPGRREGSEEAFSLEITTTALNDPSSPLYVLASDSFTVPLMLQEGKLVSPTPEEMDENPGGFWLHSYEGDSELVAEKVQSGVIASKNKTESNGDGWFKVLREMTLFGDVVEDVSLYLGFYAGTRLEKVAEFHKRKPLKEAYFSFLVNAFFYELSFYEPMRAELRKIALQEGEKSWAALLQNVLAGRSPAEARTVLKGALPLFAKELEKVEHLGETYLRCKLQFREKESYVFIPPLKEGEEEALAEWFLKESREILPVAFSQMAKLPALWIPWIVRLATLIFDRGKEDLVYFFSCFRTALNLLEMPQERTKLSIGCIEAMVQSYARKEEIPPFLWQELRSLIQVYRKEPWKRLFERLIDLPPVSLPLEGQVFFDDLFQKAYHGEEDLFIERPTEERLYRIQRALQRGSLRDPFDFVGHLAVFLENHQIEKALNLLCYQSSLFGFLSIQPICQKHFYSHRSQAVQTVYESFFLDRYESEGDLQKKWEMAVIAYINPFKSRALEETLEKGMFAAAPRDLARALGMERKAAFCKALKEKIWQEPEDKDTGERIRLLSEHSDGPESGFVLKCLSEKKHIQELFCYFPSESQKQLKKIQDEEVRFEVIKQSANNCTDPQVAKEYLDALSSFSSLAMRKHQREMQGIVLSLCDVLSLKERMFFAKSCQKFASSEWRETLFFSLLPRDPQQLIAAIENTHWTMEAMKGFVDLLLKDMDRLKQVADVLIGKVEEKDLMSEEGTALLMQLLPFLGENVKERCFRKYVNLVSDEIKSPFRKKVVWQRLTFLVREECAGLFERLSEVKEANDKRDIKFAEKLEELREVCFSDLLQKAERLWGVSQKQVRMEAEELAFLKAALPVAFQRSSATGKIAFFRQALSMPMKEHPLIAGLLYDLLSKEELLLILKQEMSGWTAEEVFRYLALKKTCACQKDPSASALEIELEEMKEIFAYVLPDVQKAIAEQIAIAGDRIREKNPTQEEVERHLSYLSSFREQDLLVDPQLLNSLFKTACRYLYFSPRRLDQELMETTGRKMREIFLSLTESEENFSFYATMEKVYSIFLKEPLDCDLAVESVIHADALVIDLLIHMFEVLPLSAQAVVCEGIFQKASREKNLRYLACLIEKLSRAQLTLEEWEAFSPIFQKSVDYLISLRESPLPIVSFTSKAMIDLFSKNKAFEQNEMTLSLVKNVHIFRRAKEIGCNRSYDIDYGVSLKFVANVGLKEGESLKAYMKKEGLPLGGDLETVVSLYDDPLTRDECKQKNLVLDLTYLKALREIETSEGCQRYSVDHLEEILQFIVCSSRSGPEFQKRMNAWQNLLFHIDSKKSPYLSIFGFYIDFFPFILHICRKRRFEGYAQFLPVLTNDLANKAAKEFVQIARTADSQINEKLLHSTSKMMVFFATMYLSEPVNQFSFERKQLLLKFFLGLSEKKAEHVKNFLNLFFQECQKKFVEESSETIEDLQKMLDVFILLIGFYRLSVRWPILRKEVESQIQWMHSEILKRLPSFQQNPKALQIFQKTIEEQKKVCIHSHVKLDDISLKLTHWMNRCTSGR